MKKKTLFISLFALGLGIFCCERGFSAIMVNRTSAEAAYPTLNLTISASSVLNAPLSLVFPYESFNHTVCRRPSSLFWINQDFDHYYLHRVEFTVPSNPANFTRVGQNVLFQSGNSYLLVPQTLTLRLTNDFGPIGNPTIQIRKPD